MNYFVIFNVIVSYKAENPEKALERKLYVKNLLENIEDQTHEYAVTAKVEAVEATI